MYNQPPNSNQQKQIQIKINDDVMKGVYTNNMMVTHTKEEFVMDFINIFPPNGIVNARVITSPGHFKRMIQAMKENLEKYENQHGRIEEAKELDKEIGFKG